MMNGKKIAAAFLGAVLLCTGPAATLLPEAFAAPQEDETAAKKPPRQKGGQPEPLTYEKAVEIENNRHAKELEAIRKHYRNHRPKLRRAIQKENERHEKNLKKIRKRFGME